jgi:hypothetical protein
MTRHARTRRTAVLGVAVALAAATVAVVLVHGSGGHATPTAQAASANEQAAQLWHNLAQCLRAHGHPAIKDPAVDSQGEPDFGAQGVQVKNATISAATVCRRELAALPVGAHERPPTAAELHQMVLFSQCMRSHGLPDWPDPRADGTFPLNQRLMQTSKDSMRAQLTPCLHYLGAGKGLRISPSSAPPGSGKAIAKAAGQ